MASAPTPLNPLGYLADLKNQLSSQFSKLSPELASLASAPAAFASTFPSQEEFNDVLKTPAVKNIRGFGLDAASAVGMPPIPAAITIAGSLLDRTNPTSIPPGTLGSPVAGNPGEAGMNSLGLPILMQMAKRDSEKALAGPTIHDIINARNELYHATGNISAPRILNSGKIKPGIGDRFEGVAMSRTPTSPEKTRQLRFVIDPNKIPPAIPTADHGYGKTYSLGNNLPAQINPSFEFETRTKEQPIDAAKAITHAIIGTRTDLNDSYQKNPIDLYKELLQSKNPVPAIIMRNSDVPLARILANSHLSQAVTGKILKPRVASSLEKQLDTPVKVENESGPWDYSTENPSTFEKQNVLNVNPEYQSLIGSSILNKHVTSLGDAKIQELVKDIPTKEYWGMVQEAQKMAKSHIPKWSDIAATPSFQKYYINSLQDNALTEHLTDKLIQNKLAPIYKEMSDADLDKAESEANGGPIFATPTFKKFYLNSKHNTFNNFIDK